MSDTDKNLKSPDSNPENSNPGFNHEPFPNIKPEKEISHLQPDDISKDPDTHTGLTSIRKLDKISKVTFNPFLQSRQNLICVLRHVVRSLVEQSVEVGGSVTDDVDCDTFSTSGSSGILPAIKHLLYQLFTVLDHILLHGLVPPLSVFIYIYIYEQLLNEPAFISNKYIIYMICSSQKISGHWITLVWWK